MTAEQLLQELETLTHAARMHRMVGIGSNAAHDPQLAATLATLEVGNFYERFLALHSCFGSHDGAHVLRALTDPSRLIRGVAITLVALVCDEAQQRLALTIVPYDGCRSLFWKLQQRGHDVLIDEFLERLATTNDFQLRKLLPWGSPTLVHQYIAPIQAALELVDWRRLTRHHPAITFELLQARAESATQFDLQLVAIVNGILPILVHRQPDLALTLVKTLARSVPLSRLDLAALLSQRPEQLADLVLQNTGDLGALDFGPVAHTLDDEHLLALQEKAPVLFASYPTERWLRQIPPDRRAALYTAFAPAWHDYQYPGRIPAEIVALLPRPQREQEGRRLLALPSLTMHPVERLAYAAFLTWDDAYGILKPFLHDPGEQVRITTLSTLVQVICYEHERLPEMLALVQAHLHEPDPVCSAMLTSLGELPQGIWSTEHLESMERIVQGVINAFDVSSSTVGALLLLITRLLPCAPAWSAAQFALVAQARGITFLYGCIDNRLSDADVRQLGPALRPVLTSWAKKGDEDTFLFLLSVFGKRVRVFEELLDALELLFNHKLSFDSYNQILSALVRYRPARAAQLIPELIQGDRNWIRYPAVLTYLLHRRQDLLTPFLKHKKYNDLFNNLSVNTNYRYRRRATLPLIRGYACWTARQQISFARTLRAVILDGTNDYGLIGRAIARLFALPAIDNRQRLALTKNQQPVVRDQALICLHLLDNSTPILPTLQEALQDERAVRAVYALRPLLLTLPPQQALTILRAAPFTRVTIAKEVVRLLGDLPGEEAFQELLKLDGQELHRDVRAALMRALWRHSGRDEAWRILEREAHSADKSIALSTVRLRISRTLAKAYRARKRFRRIERNLPELQRFLWFAEWNTITLTHLSGEHLVLKAQQRMMSLCAILLTRPEPDVRAAVLRGCTRLPAADQEQMLLIRLLEALDANDATICAAAASAIFGTGVASDAPVIGAAIERLLPNRCALQEMVPVLEKMLPLNRQQLVPVIRAIIEALAADPLTITLRLKLAIVSLPWNEVADLLIKAAATDTLHAEALLQACSMLNTVIGRYGSIGRPDYKEMVQLERQLNTSQDERLRRIALAVLVNDSEETRGWDAEQRARLEVYRADSSVLVAAAAQFTVLPATES